MDPAYRAALIASTDASNAYFEHNQTHAIGAASSCAMCEELSKAKLKAQRACSRASRAMLSRRVA